MRMLLSEDREIVSHLYLVVAMHHHNTFYRMYSNLNKDMLYGYSLEMINPW
jgi:hypothetical protein